MATTGEKLTEAEFKEEMKTVKLLWVDGGLSDSKYKKLVWDLQSKFKPEYNEEEPEDIRLPPAREVVNSPKKVKTTEEKKPANPPDYDVTKNGIIIQLCDSYNSGVELQSQMGYDKGGRSVGRASGSTGVNAYRVCTKHIGCKMTTRLAWSTPLGMFTINKDGANEHTDKEAIRTYTGRLVSTLDNSDPETDIEEQVETIMKEKAKLEEEEGAEEVSDGIPYPFTC